MEKIKCKECGKELYKKAEICINCGCNVKLNILKFVINDIIVITIIIVGAFVFSGVKKLSTDMKINAEKNAIKEVKNMYIGSWKLEKQMNVYVKSRFNNTDNVKILLDDSFNFEEEDVYWHIGNDRNCWNEDKKIDKPCHNDKATVHQALKDDEVAIDFVDEYGYTRLLCFKLENKNILKQISCQGIALDDANPNGFYENGGIDDNLEIVYKKVE